MNIKIPGIVKNTFLASTVGLGNLAAVTPSIADEKPCLGFPPVIQLPPTYVTTTLLLDCCAGTILAGTGGLAYLIYRKTKIK